MTDWRPRGPSQLGSILIAAFALVVGLFGAPLLLAWGGWPALLIGLVVISAPFLAIVLVYRYRYGRWTP